MLVLKSRSGKFAVRTRTAPRCSAKLDVTVRMVTSRTRSADTVRIRTNVKMEKANARMYRQLAKIWLALTSAYADRDSRNRKKARNAWTSMNAKLPIFTTATIVRTPWDRSNANVSTATLCKRTARRALKRTSANRRQIPPPSVMVFARRRTIGTIPAKNVHRAYSGWTRKRRSACRITNSTVMKGLLKTWLPDFAKWKTIA